MSKKTIYVCQSCGAKSPKWEGRCASCGQWNTLAEEVKDNSLNKKRSSLFHTTSVISSLSENLNIKTRRFQTSISELDRVLGGGVVPGSFILLGGPPGVGKSTLVLQTSSSLSYLGNILYVCSEESVEQTTLRAHRLNIKKSKIFLYNESSVEQILTKAKEIKPKLLIIDSIQSVYSSELAGSSGTISQIRECCGLLMSFAKSTGVCVLIVGHVTKDGSLAGPRVLEHIVDTVLSFEGEAQCRILKALKNRFGPTNEIGVFQMSSSGLKEVSNPSEFFLEERGENRIGSAVSASMQGQRPILCEIQALTLPSFLAMPRRTAVGIDLNRLHLILAVLEKYFQIHFSKYDVFLNLVGGLKILETASDMAVAMALLSSYHKQFISMKTCFFGEIGLTGEIRSCPFTAERLKEAKKLGFETTYIPSGNKSSLPELTTNGSLKINSIKNIQELESFFNK